METNGSEEDGVKNIQRRYRPIRLIGGRSGLRGPMWSPTSNRFQSMPVVSDSKIGLDFIEDRLEPASFSGPLGKNGVTGRLGLELDAIVMWSLSLDLEGEGVGVERPESESHEETDKGEDLYPILAGGSGGVSGEISQ